MKNLELIQKIHSSVNLISDDISVETKTWITRDGRDVPYTEIRGEIDSDDYTDYIVEFSVWPLSVNVCLLELSGVDGYDLDTTFVNKTVHFREKLSHDDAKCVDWAKWVRKRMYTLKELYE